MTRNALWRPYALTSNDASPLLVRGAKGSHLHLADGSRLIDGAAGWWDACHGYGHPHIQEALARQLRAMPHVLFKGFTHGPAEDLAARLTGRLGGELNHVFFTDSAASAVAAAMNMATVFWSRRGESGRRLILKAGDDDDLAAVTGSSRALIAPLTSGAASADRFRRFLEKHGRHVAAVVLEPFIDRTAPFRFLAPATVSETMALAKEHGVLVIANETFTGFGRIGSMFAFEQAAGRPDIVCLSRAMTGGFMALAAAVASDAVFDAFTLGDPVEPLMHGPTCSPSPLACAAGCASLDLFESEPRLAQARSLEVRLQEGLKPCLSLATVADVRVKGAWGVIELQPRCGGDGLRREIVRRGAWARTSGDLVHLAPALNIADEDLSELCSAVVSALKNQPLPGCRS